MFSERELVTPDLDGLILPGVTRMSILDLARGWNEFKVSERKMSMKELLEISNDKRVSVAFFFGGGMLFGKIAVHGKVYKRFDTFLILTVYLTSENTPW